MTTGLGLAQLYSRQTMRSGAGADEPRPDGDRPRAREAEHGQRLQRGRHGQAHARHLAGGDPLPAPQHAGRMAVPGAAPALTAAASLSYQRAERTELQIRTQEGDLVSLKFRTRDRLDVQAASRDDAGRLVSEIGYAGRSDTRIAVTVDGDLNADELLAIQAVVEQVGNLAADFFAGGAADAFDAAAGLNIDASQLLRVDLGFSLRERFTYSDLGLRTPGSAGAASVSAEPAVSAPPADRERPLAAAQDDATALAADPGAPAAVPPPPAESQIAAPAQDRSGFMANTLGTISAFLGRLRDSFDTAPAVGAASMDFSLKLKIFESVLYSGNFRSGGAAPVPELVPQTLEAVAAERQPPLAALA